MGKRRRPNYVKRPAEPDLTVARTGDALRCAQQGHPLDIGDEKRADEFDNLVARALEEEVAAVEQMDLGIR